MPDSTAKILRTSPNNRNLFCMRLAKCLFVKSLQNAIPTSVRCKLPARLLTRPTLFKKGAYSRHCFGVDIPCNSGRVSMSVTSPNLSNSTNYFTKEKYSCFLPNKSGIDHDFFRHSLFWNWISVKGILIPPLILWLKFFFFIWNNSN